MSAPNLRLVVTPAARFDLRQLLVYSTQQWGTAQRRAYRQRFTEAFAELVRFPEIGLARPDLGTDLRSYRVGQHVVIYRPSQTELRIIRVLHSRRDFAAELG
jgi:toxin ParE1/3/4